MNKIFKVIWSKSRNCYVVASELAKGTSKSTSTGRMAKRAALAAVAALLLFPVGIGTTYAAVGQVGIGKYGVLTGTSDDAKDINNTISQVKTNTTQISNNSSSIGKLSESLTTLETKVNSVGENIVALDTQVKANADQFTTDKTSTALHISSTGDLIVGTKENQTVKDMEIRGKLTSGSLSTGDITSTGDVTVKGKMAADGVTDETTKDGTYIKQNNTVGNNLVSLDKQVKANDDRITAVKEYLQNETENNYVSKAGLASELEVKDAGVVKTDQTIGENVTALGKALSDETAARIGADKAQDKLIQGINNSLVDTIKNVNTVNQNMANGFNTLSQVDANEAATREAKDNELNERITNEANAIHETTNKLQSDLNTETAAREAGDTALNERITNVKEYLEKQTSDNYVSKTDAAVQDGAIVKAANTIGDNVTKLDAALAKETADRLGADAAQDKVIQTVNDNLVSSVNTINKNMADGFNALSQADAKEAAARAEADAAETAGRVAADKKLVEAVNSGLSLSDDNVLQKNTTTIDAQGNVTTSKTDAKEMILNKGKDNQITLNEKGIKVGTNSTVVDANGVYTGGDTYSEAKAAMSADGKIKGANGAFTVDENGNVTSKATITGETVTDGKGASMSNGTVTGKTLTDGIATITNGNINTSGTITGGTVTSTGNISALGDIHAGGAITGASASIQGALTAGSATITGDLTADGAIQGKSISDGTATMQNGNLTGVKNLSAETITTSGDATIGGDLTVNGKLNVDEIDLTKNGIVGDNNVTASTKVAAGEITSYKKATSTKDGSEKESAIDYDENGTSTWAKSTDADGNWKKSTLTVEGSDVTSKVVDSDKNSNLATQTSTQSQSTLTDADKNTNTATQSAAESSSVLQDKDGKTSTFKQRVGEILNQINSSDMVFSKVDQKVDNITSEVKNGDNSTSTTQSATDITNTAKQGTITNEAQKLVNKASDTISNEAANDITNTSTNGNISNTANNGTISNTAKNIENTASENITNTAKNGSITNDAKNIANIASETLSNNAKNITNTTTDNMTNTIGKNLTTTVGGDMSTEVTGSQSTTVNGNQTNTVKGTLTETVTGDVTEDYKANLSTTVGGNQTTTVIGDSSLTAENITNEAKNKITNKAIDVETDATSSIVSKVSNDAGSNTSTQLSYQTTEEMSQADGKKASYLRGAAEEKSQLTDGDKKTTIDTIASQTNTNITDGTNTSNSLQKADQVASSVTDGTNTTVVNQDATSLASSITDGTKANNTNNTVDKSEQLIKASDTQYSATSKTATKMEDALVNGSTIINSVKDSTTGTVSSAVTDGSTITGISQNAKDISLSATGGTIANEAKNITNTATEKLSNSATDIENKASNSILNQVGDNTSWKMTNGKVVEAIKGADGQTNTTTTTADDTYQSVQNGNNVLAKRTSSTNDNLNITDGTNTYSKITTATSNKQTVTDGTETASTNLTKSASNTYITNGTQTVTNHIAADTTNTVMNEGSNGSRQEQTASQILNRVTDGTDTSEVKQTASEVATSAKDITNTATKITNITGNTTVTSDTTGTTFENTDHNTAIKDGTITKTTISGNTLTTGQATMDYADVMKDLGVRGNATVDGDTTLGKEGADTKLTVNSKSTFKDTVKLEKTLEVDGTSTFNDKVTVTKGGLDVNGGMTTDTLHVTGTSTFEGAATFKDVVTMEKDLSVGGNATVAGSMTASSYKVGNKTYIDSNGINANDQKVVNVAPGRIAADSKDAVNGSQLYQTNERVTGVENKVNNLDSRVDKVGANAAALANLHPLEFDADSKWNIAAAVGGYKGETATAIGAFYRPNENVMINVSSSFGTGENMYGGGISLRIGQGGNKARRNATNGLTEREKAQQKQIDYLTSRLDALLSVINPNMSKDFPDVPENHWAYEAVSKLAGNGVIQGYEDGKYHGERTMTRYEMAEIIYNALSKGAKAEKKLVEEFKPELQAMAAQKKA